VSPESYQQVEEWSAKGASGAAVQALRFDPIVKPFVDHRHIFMRIRIAIAQQLILEYTDLFLRYPYRAKVRARG